MFKKNSKDLKTLKYCNYIDFLLPCLHLLCGFCERHVETYRVQSSAQKHLLKYHIQNNRNIHMFFSHF